MQDMGAAGIICSTSEMSAKGECGMKINLDLVPKRQEGMLAHEILLSESQERMLVVVKKGREAEVKAIFDKWDVPCVQIGEVVDTPNLEFTYEGKLVASVPAESLVLGGGAPQYEREYKEPAYYKEYQKFDISQVAEPEDVIDVAKRIIGLPNIASKRWVYEQYDRMVGDYNLSINIPSDAGVVAIRNSKKSLAVSVDCNPRYVKADPYIGAMIAVAEAARNVVCSGGTPLAITNCLNFGNPYNPEVYWQFVRSIEGIATACKRLETPVTGGNVSFYNQSTIGERDEAVSPTPVIGMLGILDDISRRTSLAFAKKGHMIYLLGNSRNDISSSEYLVSICGINESGAPRFDIEEEVRLQRLIERLIKERLIESAHDVSTGGLFTTLVECAMPNELGFDITSDAEVRLDAFLFGESQSRVVVSVSQECEEKFVDFMIESDVPMCLLGHVTRSEIRVDDISYGFIPDYKHTYDTALETRLTKMK